MRVVERLAPRLQSWHPWSNVAPTCRTIPRLRSWRSYAPRPATQRPTPPFCDDRGLGRRKTPSIPPPAPGRSRAPTGWESLWSPVHGAATGILGHLAGRVDPPRRAVIARGPLRTPHAGYRPHAPPRWTETTQGAANPAVEPAEGIAGELLRPERRRAGRTAGVHQADGPAGPGRPAVDGVSHQLRGPRLQQPAGHPAGAVRAAVCPSPAGLPRCRHCRRAWSELLRLRRAR